MARKREDDTDKSNNKKKTSRTFHGIKDIRAEKKSGKYPNQIVEKDRSGNSFIRDYTEGNESITIQHRSGSAIQFLPNGAIQMTCHNGKYDIVFGESRMSVTGANDISVKGDASLRVFGDYRVTVHGNMEYSATGSIAFTGKNILHTASENFSSISQTTTMKSSDAVQISANKHASFVADNTVLAGRQSAFVGGTKLALEGVNEASFKSSEGKMQVASATDFTHDVGGDVTRSYQQSVDDTIGQNVTRSVGGNRHLSVAGSNVQKVTGDSSHDIGGTLIHYAQQALHLNGPQGGTPNTPQQLSLFDIIAGLFKPGTGQENNDTDFA